MIGIVGYGVIGKATKYALFPEHNVLTHDILDNTQLSDLVECDIIFVCVPTDNQEHINNVKSICCDIGELNPEIEIVIRSTITPGFFVDVEKKVKNNLTYFPEFLRERHSLEDSLDANVLFYGTTGLESKLTRYKRFKYKLKRRDISELELLKMMRNNFHCMKIVFANHYYDICQKYGVDYQLLLESFHELKNFQSYLDANENLRGYGGKCLPKDMDFMIDIFGDIDLFKAIKNDNSRWPITVEEETE